MFDLDRLHYANEQAHLLAVQRANEQAARDDQPPPPPVYPLAILARKLLVGPPSLAVLIDLMEGTEYVSAFMELVREFLPDLETEIQATDIYQRIDVFVHHFNQRYFPLSETTDWEEFTLADFLHHIPVELWGFTYTDYHEFQDFRPGHIAQLALTSHSFSMDEEGARIPILETLAEMAGPGVVEHIPAAGWSQEELHKKLDGTKYEGAAVFADWVNQDTGTIMLNGNYEEYDPEPWTRSTVDMLTEERSRVLELWDKMSDMSAWLEEDLPKNIRELVFFIIDKKEEVIPKEQLPLPLIEIFK